MSEAEKFLDKHHFHLTIDCKRELPYIIMAMQEYADQEVEKCKQEIRHFLISMDYELLAEDI